MSGRARFFPLLVTAIERLTPDAVAVTLAPPAGTEELFRFLPGQHLTFRQRIDGEEVRRSYSICSAPTKVCCASASSGCRAGASRPS